MLVKDLEDVTKVERFLEFDFAHNLVVSNPYFMKRQSHQVTSQSDENQSQIEYWCENDPNWRMPNPTWTTCLSTKS